MNSTSSVLVVAGEDSGDLLAANLVLSISSMRSGIEFWGVGGNRLANAGVQLIADTSATAVSGFAEVVRHYPRLRTLFNSIIRRCAEQPPSMAILVDYPGFNLRLARRLHLLGIRVVFYVAPQVWAWKEKRVELIRRYVNSLIVVFPFEVEYFKLHDIQAYYFGNPHADAYASSTYTDLDVSTTSRLPIIAYFPGSRSHEVSKHISVMRKIAVMIGTSFRHVVVRASTVSASFLAAEIQDSPMEISDDSTGVLRTAVAGVIKAGTSTLDAALAGLPFVAVYKTSTLSFFISRLLIKVKWIAMPNILAGRTVVPEFIQAKLQPGPVARQLLRLVFNDRERAVMTEAFDMLRLSLAVGDSVRRAASFIVSSHLSHLDATTSGAQ